MLGTKSNEVVAAETRTVSFVSTNNQAITISALIFVPPTFDETIRYPAIVVTHPSGGVKEQTVSLYAARFAARGFVAIACDASYQGESTGEPRLLENPYVRTEDISAAIDHLTTLRFVDADRIGAFGICAGAGYTVNAAINDKRIKAVGVVSAVNLGAILRKSAASADDLQEQLLKGAWARSAEANGTPAATIPILPAHLEDTATKEQRDTWEYYHTARGGHPRAFGFIAERSLTQLMSYDAFNLADELLIQPLQIVAGSQADTKWMSDELYDRAASTEKRFHVVENSNHMDLYDNLSFVDEASSELASFFSNGLDA